MRDNLFIIQNDIDIQSKNEIYRVLSHSVHSESEADLVCALEQREKKGNIAIAEEVLLPHIESNLISESKVVVLRLKNNIRWNSDVGDIKLLIAIFLREAETADIKRKISNFSRKLASDDYLNDLLNKDNLYEVIEASTINYEGDW